MVDSTGREAHLSSCPGVMQVMQAHASISTTLLVEGGYCHNQIMKCVEQAMKTYGHEVGDVYLRTCSVNWTKPCLFELPELWSSGNQTLHTREDETHDCVDVKFVRNWPGEENNAPGINRIGRVPLFASRYAGPEAMLEHRQIRLAPRRRQLGRFYQECQPWLSFRRMWKKIQKNGTFVYFFRAKTGGLGNKLMVLRYVFFLSLILKRELVIIPSDGIDIGLYFEEHLFQWKPKNQIRAKIHARRCFACNQLHIAKDEKATANRYTYLNSCTTAEMFASCNLGKHLRQQAPTTDTYLQGVLRLWETKHCFLASFFIVRQAMEDLLPEPFVKASHRVALHVRWGDYYLKSVQEGEFAHGSDRRIGLRKLERCLRRMDLLHHTVHALKRNQSTYLFAASDMSKMLHSVIQGMKNFTWTGRSPEMSNIHMLPESKSFHTGRRIEGNSMDKSFRPAIYDFLGLSLSDLVYAPAASTFSRQASEFGLIKLINHC
mmetsp:Transcript_3845/g.24358  ORF Transcript_3845/g.24358 Transcript_3845/m.24358 type:complete len:489 (+) Transcript_3845:2855-4321(+)